jgi:hypothetical protein
MKLEVTTEELRKYSIFVGTPMFGGQCAGLFAKSTADLAALGVKYGVDVRFYYLFNESLVQRARNYVVDEFLRSECTHLMFIDSDIGFKAKDVFSLLAIQISDPEKYDIVTGPYPKKTIAWEKVKKAVEMNKANENPFHLEYYSADYVFNPVENASSFRIDAPVEVAEAGTGFMLIPRSVFEKYEASYPQYKYLPDHVRTENFDGSREIMAYFDCAIDPVSKRYLSEDYFFCQNSRKIGLKLWMCPWMELQHVGSYIFKGSMAAIGSLGVSPTADENSNKKNYSSKKQLTKTKKRNKINH